MKTSVVFSFSSHTETCEVTQTAVKENKAFRIIKTEIVLFIVLKKVNLP